MPAPQRDEKEGGNGAGSNTIRIKKKKACSKSAQPTKEGLQQATGDAAL
jgi:hypothetical protein